MEFLKIIRTNPANADYQKLVKLLDADLANSDGDEHKFYNQYNGSDLIKHVLVVYVHDIPVGCGAIKRYAAGTMEVKRMYVKPDYRGRKIATQILTTLEKWAHELKYEKCILETGKRQPAAIQLYEKSGYIVTENYGQYIGVENSVCFEKKLASKKSVNLMLENLTLFDFPSQKYQST